MDSAQIQPVTYNQKDSETEKVQKTSFRFHTIPVLLFTFVVVLLTSGAFFLGQKYAAPKENLQPVVIVPTIIPTSIPTTDPIEEWKTYTSAKNLFSFNYPTYFTYLSEENNKDTIVLSPKEGSLFTLDANKDYWMTVRYTKLDKSGMSYWGTQYSSASSGNTVNGIKFINNKVFPKTGTEAAYGFEAWTLINENLYKVSLWGRKENVGHSSENKILFDQILSTFRFLDNGDTTVTPVPQTSYTAPSNWTKTALKNGLTLCLPPKWEYNGFADLEYHRDPGYKPTITTIAELPYSGGSKREAYFAFWKSEYPDVESRVSIKETDINGNAALTIYSATPQEVKQSPDGSLAVVWYGNNKLWKAGLSNWSSINESQIAFLSDFYKTISCSF